MADTESHLQQWRTLKEQGINGEFRLDTEIGQALHDRCEALRQQLLYIRRDAQQLDRLSGYGGLPSANELRVKFEQKATGGAPHDPNDNALARIDQHIEIVTTMRDAYLAAIGQLQAVDEESSRTLTAQGDEIN
ncbi:hypothetical protein IU443_21410 [Nocardia farcinica]|uniref:Uncharacterized protein n=1 Tax=Nocardia farcinica TaxID=37329 RepID=A0A0H5P3T3_NOCFR|nr:hypothetical protein [Nocardia farcinica]AXK87713.1 hypothetical protein DXT66_20650 [Nocardia farcinica]MBF6071920.1 hypothetical protein [Nocardia farcinica]MBF6264833.1 hypothetical protein [Nocardia farcinica]MBF6283619.1 hypothetical protein [Nocardia farcinica]MBF6307428.1 hypothetical protein [Nocardia farcinica]